METLRDTPLAAYCSHGNSFESFATSAANVQADTESLLQLYGASETVRAQLQKILSNHPDFASGIRLETGVGEERTVVYVTYKISPIDDGKKPLATVLALRSREAVRRGEAKAAWRAA